MYSFHTWLQDLEDQVRDQDQILDQELDLNLDQGFVAEPQDELLCILFIELLYWKQNERTTS